MRFGSVRALVDDESPMKKSSVVAVVIIRADGWRLKGIISCGSFWIYVGWLLEDSAAVVAVVGCCSRLYEAAAVMYYASILGGYCWFGQQLTINQCRPSTLFLCLQQRSAKCNNNWMEALHEPKKRFRHQLYKKTHL